MTRHFHFAHCYGPVYALFDMPRRTLTHPLLLAVVFAAAGILFGASLYTFVYAKGYSYLSNDPTACANCHIMRPQLDGWQKSSHHGVAACNDCHTPHNFVGKYLTKLENGYSHSRAFTFQDFHEPIEMRTVSRDIVLENCIGCHGEMVSGMLPGNAAAPMTRHDAMPAAADCIQCHRGVGHGTLD
jgi:cytochrome c nitrite reductase small subunit